MLVSVRCQDESLRIGNDIKITIINIGKDKIMLGVNDSESVIINLQESISIRDGITVKVVKQIRLRHQHAVKSLMQEDHDSV